MLVPLALAIALAVSYRRASDGKAGDGKPGGGQADDGKPGGGQAAGAPVRLAAIFPWFVLWFAGAALLHSVGVLPPALVRTLGLAGKFLVVMVMAAVGLGADAAAMRRLGMRPLLIGLAAAVMIAALSLTLAQWLGS
jgi:uncharacterized membrane protein YadS